VVLREEWTGMRTKFGTLGFYKKAVWIAVPVMLQQLIQTMVSLIDNFMVAGLGDVKMSGVNIAGQILFTFMVFMNTICTAGGIYMTQYSGAGDRRGMRQALMFKSVIAAGAFVFYILACMVFQRNILSLMVIGNSQAQEILDVGVEYMYLMGYIGAPMIISTILASSMREIGRVKVPLVISVIATLINTFFNWVLIYGNLGAPRLEVRGAAYATIIARAAEALMFICYVSFVKQPFMPRLSEGIHIDWRLFGQIFRKGYLVLASEMLWVISETVTTALYNGRGGADVVSGMASSFAIANLFFVAFSGITTATGVIIGKTLGEGNLEEAKREKTWMLSAAIVFGFVMTVAGMLTTILIPLVFGNLSEGAQSICRQMVMMMALFMPMWVYVNVQFAVSRAGGDTVMGAVVDGVWTLGLILPGLFVLARYTRIGPVKMYFAVKIVDIPKIMTAHFWLKKERWVRNLTGGMDTV